jgi:hypothetical protein
MSRESVAVEYPMCSAWTFRDGTVMQLVLDPDPEQAIAAVLPPQPGGRKRPPAYLRFGSGPARVHLRLQFLRA